MFHYDKSHTVLMLIQKKKKKVEGRSLSPLRLFCVFFRGGQSKRRLRKKLEEEKRKVNFPQEVNESP